MRENASEQDPISQKFVTYIIELFMESKGYYAVWYTDMSTPEEQDKLLTDADGKVIVFPKISSLKSYIRSVLPELPCSENFAGWIEHHRSEKPYAIYDIDSARKSIAAFEGVSLLAKETALEQIDIFNLIGDYRDGTNDAYLEAKMSDPIMRGFFDGAYTFFFWKTPEDAVDPGINPEKFKSLYNEIINYFVSRMRIITE